MRANPSTWNSRPGGLDTLNTRTIFESSNLWGIPSIKPTERVPAWLAPYRTRFRSKRELDLDSGAYHFFLPPERLDSVWQRPTPALKSIKRLGSVLSPAFPLSGTKSEQLFATYKNRWCGAWWESQGITVIPSVLWNGEESYDFAFAGVARGSIVAIAGRNWKQDPNGFDCLRQSLRPVKILCFGDPQVELPELVTYPERFRLRLIESR